MVSAVDRVRTRQWRRILALGLLLGLGGGCAGARVGEVQVRRGPALRARSPERLAERTAGAVAVITTDTGRGMAFVVDPAGFLLTNRHVVEDAGHIAHVVFPALDPQRRFTAVQIVYVDPLRDLALLKVDVERPLPSLALASDRAVPVGDYVAEKDLVMMLTRAVAADLAPVGDPGELDPDDEAAGLVAQLGHIERLDVYNPSVGPGPYLGMSLDVREGNSGGPVVDRHGRAVGVVTWTWRHRRGGFAIPISEANHMLAERPRLRDAADHRARMRSRADEYLAALGAGEIETIRRLSSPSHAREFREAVLPGLLQHTMVETTAVEEYVGAIDALLRTASETGTDPFPAFARMVEETADAGFRERAGVAEVDHASVMAFFFELGQAYLAARHFGERSEEEAVQVALERLHSLEVARNLVLAHRLGELDGEALAVESVKLVPGRYAPQGVVTVQRGGSGEGARVAVQMRLEWGDWYVGEVQAIGER